MRRLSLFVLAFALPACLAACTDGPTPAESPQHDDAAPLRHPAGGPPRPFWQSPGDEHAPPPFGQRP